MPGAVAISDKQKGARDPAALQNDYPLANTEAARMLTEALKRADEEKGWSQRYIARVLNYKTSVVLSHMALGRVPIPIDRAMDFCRVLDMDPSKFIMAVLEQRHPDINFRRVFSGQAKTKASSTSSSILASELEDIAGTELDNLPVPVINVLREVVSDRNGARRFLRMSEVPLIEHLRDTHPEGLSPADMKKVQDFIANL